MNNNVKDIVVTNGELYGMLRDSGTVGVTNKINATRFIKKRDARDLISRLKGVGVCGFHFTDLNKRSK